MSWPIVSPDSRAETQNRDPRQRPQNKDSKTESPGQGSGRGSGGHGAELECGPDFQARSSALEGDGQLCLCTQRDDVGCCPCDHSRSATGAPGLLQRTEAWKPGQGEQARPAELKAAQSTTLHGDASPGKQRPKPSLPQEGRPLRARGPSAPKGPGCTEAALTHWRPPGPGQGSLRDR